ncbi:LysM peptidoglycan-binding domain-containing protein [Rhodococcus pyridinivorans]|uniref:LysM peptidoglycan-binding domain-containing protein n=1 Tax=Rhodococcus pyridinivorans TaxID=103816 RepID=UPI003FD82DB1
MLAAANRIADPNVIQVGRSLLIPELGDVGHHTVVAGETLWELARRWYGEAQLYPVISFPNHITDPDPDHVEVGRVLIRPGLNYRHTVVPGDTLRALAEDHYGNAEMFAMIAAANHIADRTGSPSGRCCSSRTSPTSDQRAREAGAGHGATG